MNKFNKIENPIIFFGTGRSGTTIISEIICRHPHIAYPSSYHTKFYKNQLINFVRILFENKLWKIYGQKRQLNKVNFLNKVSFKPSEAYEMWNYLTSKNLDFSRDFLVDVNVNNKRKYFIRKYFNNMVRFQNKKRLAIKITGPSRISYLMSIFPDAYFVNIKRRRIPTISSFLKVGFWKNKGFNNIWWTGGYNKDEIDWMKINTENPILLTAFQLKKVEEITKYEVEKYLPKYIEVNYENFLDNPKKVIFEILEFIKLEGNSSNCFEYLEKIGIYNQNKPDVEYFNKDEIIQINEIYM